MGSPQADTFASLLRRYRRAAGLTQEELAERARLSVQAIGALERGDRRAPRKATIGLLAEALALKVAEREVFEAMARRRNRAEQITPGDLAEDTAEDTAGDASSTDAAPSSVTPAGADAEAGMTFRQRYRAWNIPYPVTKGLSLSRSGRKLSGSMVAVLIVALLGSGLLLKGEGTPLLCGGALTLATNFSIQGDDDGKSAENAINLAVMQNRNLGSGYTIQAINYDDVSAVTGLANPKTGAGNVRRIVTNPCIVGIVGPIKSKVAPDEMPIAANAGLVMISPTTTDPGLTSRLFAESEGLNFDALHPPGKPINYFRIVSNDAAQAIADAALAFNLGAKSVYAVNNPSPYGGVLAGTFTLAFERKGGRVIGIDTLGLDPSVIPDIAARIVAVKPDAVFYGGLTSSGGGLLKAKLVKLGYSGFFVSGDGIANDPDFVKQAGADAATGTFASVVGPDPSTFTSGAAAQFVSDYAARYPGQDLSSYGAEAYDAAMVLIGAIKHLIATGQAVTRAALVEQVRHIQYTGVSGPISFDANGDIAHGVYSIYAVQNGRWVYAWQMSV